VTRPRLLDLGCCQGGATRGYQLAGFYVIGVDIEPQPRYVGDEFIQADMLTVDLGGYDAYHCSAPCQRWAASTPAHLRHTWPDLITPMRARLTATGKPYVLENVPRAPLRPDLVLCGCMFPECGRLQRKRWFETWPRLFDLRPECRHEEPAITITTKGCPNRTGAWEEAKRVMGITWASQRGVGEAIPPAYTEHVGGLLLEHLRGSVT
jgi:DNA (cytosine-5)-methyltransferase 1